MAITKVQHAIAHNFLNQTFNVILGATPTEGNLLVALSWHDRTAGDVEGNPGSGYTRLGTHEPLVSGLTLQASVFAKFAGAGESATTLFDFGEANRRGHGHMVEFSGQEFTSLQSADAADKAQGTRDPAGTTLQVGPITIPVGLIGIAINGTNNSSSVPPNWSAEAELTDIVNLNANFRGTGSAWVEGADQTISPVSSWNTSRQASQILVIVGIPPPGSTVLKGSSFRVTPAS